MRLRGICRILESHRDGREDETADNHAANDDAAERSDDDVFRESFDFEATGYCRHEDTRRACDARPDHRHPTATEMKNEVFRIKVRIIGPEKDDLNEQTDHKPGKQSAQGTDE